MAGKRKKADRKTKHDMPRGRYRTEGRANDGNDRATLPAPRRPRGKEAPGRGKRPPPPAPAAPETHEAPGGTSVDLSSHGLHRSTFGDGELNCRVRHGIG